MTKQTPKKIGTIVVSNEKIDVGFNNDGLVVPIEGNIAEAKLNVGPTGRKLILTVGIPLCGKSQWASNSGFPVVSPDRIREIIYDGYAFPPVVNSESKNVELIVWNTAKIMVQSLFLSGSNTVVLDATNVKSYNRRSWQSDKWTVFYKVFNADVDACHENARINGVQHMHNIIHSMASYYEPLTETEQFYVWPD